MSLADALINRDSAPGRPPLIRQCGSDLCDLTVGGLALQVTLPLPLSVFFFSDSWLNKAARGPGAEDDAVTDRR